MRAIASVGLRSVAFIAFAALSGAASADAYYGNYCSMALYGSSWGVLIDDYASSAALCARIQREFLYGQYPNQQSFGFYNRFGINTVSVRCDGAYPLSLTRTGYGSQPFYDAYDIVMAQRAQGCLFTNFAGAL